MYKKNILFLTFFSIIFAQPLLAQKKGKNKSTSKKIVKNTSSKKEKKSNNQENAETPVKKEKTCQEKYNACMDKYCINEYGIRYNCETSYDSFDTVNIDKNKIRVGHDLFSYATGSCLNVLKSCELSKRDDIVNQYKAQIATDFLTKNYIDARNYTGEEASQEALQNYIACMEPLCGPSFSDCFKISAVERRASQCESVLKSTGRPLAVKRAFYDKIEELNRNFCKQKGGYIDYDTKICKVEVVFGKPRYKWKDGIPSLVEDDPLEKELAKRHFNVGEMVECTQAYFSTFYEENENMEKGIVKVVQGASRILTGVGYIVGGVFATIFSGGSKKDLIGSGVKMTANGIADTIDGAVILDDGEKMGACYIDGKYLAPINTYFRINILQ